MCSSDLCSTIETGKFSERSEFLQPSLWSSKIDVHSIPAHDVPLWAIVQPNGLFGLLSGTIHRLVPAPKRYKAVEGSGFLEELVPFVTFIMHLKVTYMPRMGKFIHTSPYPREAWESRVPFPPWPQHIGVVHVHHLFSKLIPLDIFIWSVQLRIPTIVTFARSTIH